MREATNAAYRRAADRAALPAGAARACQHGAVGSLHDLACAAQHLRHYTAPGSGRAFHVYDRAGQPDILEPVDALAPALLDAPVRRELVVKLFGSDAEPYVQLRQAMQQLLDETAESEPHFESLDLDDESGPWMLVRRVLQATDGARGLKAAMVTKMLHRKRPLFVPIFDSKVATFYGATSSRPWRLWPALQADVRSATDLLDDLRSGVTTPDGRPLSRLRTADIVIWEHEITACQG